MAGTIAQWLGIGKEVADVTNSVTNGVSNIINTVKDQVPPELRGEIEKQQAMIDGEVAKLKISGEQKINELVQNSVEQARQFAIKYEGSADQIPKWLLVVRSIIRPTVTLLTFGWFFAALSVDLYHAMKRTADYVWILNTLPQGFWWILGIILTFWFGGKVGERITEKIKGETK